MNPFPVTPYAVELVLLAAFGGAIVIAILAMRILRHYYLRALRDAEDFGPSPDYLAQHAEYSGPDSIRLQSNATRRFPGALHHRRNVP